MTEQTQDNGKVKPKPAFTVKARDTAPGSSNFITIGAAWLNDNGSIYVKFNGHMIVDAPFYLFPINK